MRGGNGEHTIHHQPGRQVVDPTFQPSTPPSLSPNLLPHFGKGGPWAAVTGVPSWAAWVSRKSGPGRTVRVIGSAQPGDGPTCTTTRST